VLAFAMVLFSRTFHSLSSENIDEMKITDA
jgi:hypothetical protein